VSLADQLNELRAAVAAIGATGHSTARPQRMLGVHHCWVCDTEVTQVYWTTPGTPATHAVWWGHCETSWFDIPTQLRDLGPAA
jgi:hypothetical protein